LSRIVVAAAFIEGLNTRIYQINGRKKLKYLPSEGQICNISNFNRKLFIYGTWQGSESGYLVFVNKINFEKVKIIQTFGITL
jgi:hypothetical protein